MSDWAGDVQRWIVDETKDLRQTGEDAAREWAEAGRDAMRQQITDATTKTGDARVAAGGGSAGRRETDTMFNAVTATPPEWIDQNTVEARFGWPEEDLQPYFMEQELNLSGRINGNDAREGAMHSLNVGATVADDALDARLR